MAQPKITVTINEAAAMLREAGMKVTPMTLGDGIESGAYPFGRLVKKTNGRRHFEIFTADLQQWIASKTPMEV